MSLLDLLVVIVIGASMAAGFVAGFARVSIGFLAAILGVVLGFWFYGIPAGWVHRYLHSAAISNLIGFLLVFWAILAIGALFAKVTSKLFKWTGLSWLDRLLGGAFGLVRGALIAVVMIAVLLGFHSQAHAELDCEIAGAALRNGGLGCPRVACSKRH